jgi:hypothetical protein
MRSAIPASSSRARLRGSGRRQEPTTLDLPGVERPVEILKDRWGIAHTYAETEHPLFFERVWKRPKAVEGRATARWSAQRKVEVVLRLLRGKDPQPNGS